MMPLRSLKLCGLTAALLFALMAAGDERSPAAQPMDAEFRFVRMQYSERSGARGWGRWLVDYPEAEYFFTHGVRRLTRVDIGEPQIVRLTDDALFLHPWLYAVEVGYWYLSDVEAARLREYLLRGGFLMVDDFHGTLEWAQFIESMTRVFPDRPIVDIPDGDAVLNVLYELDQRIQIPGIGAWMRGRTYERDGYDPHWRGIYDDHGRLVVAINFNMDLGDAWEHADDPRYPEAMTRLAYQFAVNYVIYAMTH
jgi:hypothetical protein